VVVADPAACSLQFDPVGKSAFVTSCDIAKSYLANAGISYDNQPAASGAIAVVKVGEVVVTSLEGGGLDKASLKAARADVEGRLKAALAEAGYPAKADPARINVWGLFGVLLVFTVAATALYGPQASALVEMFPTSIRYTSMSLPYHIGNGWFGGFLPTTAFAMVAATGNIYYGLWYPVVVAMVTVVVGFLFIRDRKDVDIHT
jgi:hypothetical protein